tara:strand:- start:1162 stop:1353 length:192 start_codon:yes stop_codon:yes gene_type:complete
MVMLPVTNFLKAKFKSLGSNFSGSQAKGFKAIDITLSKNARVRWIFWLLTFCPSEVDSNSFAK